MRRRNLLKLTGYGGVGLATALRGNRAIATATKANTSDLPTFNFATLKIDSAGLEKERTYHNAKLHIEDLGNFQTLSMVAIRQGEFIMGASAMEKDSGNESVGANGYSP